MPFLFLLSKGGGRKKPYFGLIRTQVTKSVENRKDRLLKKDNENTAAAIIFE